MEFYAKVSPSFRTGSGILGDSEINSEGQKLKKYQIPPPTLCPDCRQQRRLSFRNERKLYKRKCDATGKEIVSIYSPDKPFKVYHQDYWWSDSWDPMEYGREFDFSRGFFEQFGEMMREVPKIGLSVENQENSEYSNYAGWNKNCYLIFLGANNEDCYFSNGVWDSKNTLDCSHSRYISESYNLTNSANCSNCSFLQNSNECGFCDYSSYLIQCNNCLFCINLHGKEYYILNQKISKDEFNSLKKKIFGDKNFFRDISKKYETLMIKNPIKENSNIGSENFSGNYIQESKNIFSSFDVQNSENCKYVTWLFDSRNCMDLYDWGSTAQNIYESLKIGNGALQISFSAFCLSNVEHLIYCFDCTNNTHQCFGCIGLRNKSYCIFNKQYTKEAYESLVPRIIEHMMKTGEWGEFFPASLSPFGYNETVAQEYFPLTRDSVIARHEAIQVPETLDRHTPLHSAHDDESRQAFLHGPIFNWSDYEAPFPTVEKIIPGSKLPDSIESIPDDILNWAIECEVTKKPFRIIRQELEFYRKHNLPIPRRHPDQRYLDRMSLRNPRKLFERKCDKCGKDMITTYAPERTEMVYCEECYNKVIY